MILGEFLVGKETFWLFLWSSSANKISVNGVQLILTGNHKNISTSQGHLRLTDIHLFNGYCGGIDFIFKYSVFLILLRLYLYPLEVVAYHIYGRSLYPLMVLLNSPYLEHFVTSIEVRCQYVVLVIYQVNR
jgi:hypothetical protein